MIVHIISHHDEDGDSSFLSCFQHVCCQFVSWAREAPGHPELQLGCLSPGGTEQIDAQEACSVLEGLVLPRDKIASNSACLAVAAPTHALTAHSM
jgi:uncharacterized radical SAM superfamily protein